MIREMQANDGSSQIKNWELDEAIFQKPAGAVNKDFLNKTSSEMFVIYKYTQDPHMMVKSPKYTSQLGENFIECRHLLPQEESLLFENSILNELLAKDAENSLQKMKD